MRSGIKGWNEEWFFFIQPGRQKQSQPIIGADAVSRLDKHSAED